MFLRPSRHVLAAEPSCSCSAGTAQVEFGERLGAAREQGSGLDCQGRLVPARV